MVTSLNVVINSGLVLADQALNIIEHLIKNIMISQVNPTLVLCYT